MHGGGCLPVESSTPPISFSQRITLWNATRALKLSSLMARNSLHVLPDGTPAQIWQFSNLNAPAQQLPRRRKVLRAWGRSPLPWDDLHQTASKPAWERSVRSADPSARDAGACWNDIFGRIASPIPVF